MTVPISLESRTCSVNPDSRTTCLGHQSRFELWIYITSHNLGHDGESIPFPGFHATFLSSTSIYRAVPCCTEHGLPRLSCSIVRCGFDASSLIYCCFLLHWRSDRLSLHHGPPIAIYFMRCLLLATYGLPRRRRSENHCIDELP